MKIPSALILSLSALAFTSTTTLAESLKWQTDFPKAQAEAKTAKKPVLLDFTGSDWCGWCMKMDKDTFSKAEFKEYAAKNLVLVELDFPQGKRQTSKLKEQNAELKSKYGVRGFPSFVLLDAEGNELWRHSGYLAGGPQALISQLEAAAKK